MNLVVVVAILAALGLVARWGWWWHKRRDQEARIRLAVALWVAGHLPHGKRAEEGEQ